MPIGVSLEPAVRSAVVGAAGVASGELVPASIMYSSPSIISWRRMRFARALMSSKPCPANCARKESCSVRPKNR